MASFRIEALLRSTDSNTATATASLSKLEEPSVMSLEKDRSVDNKIDVCGDDSDDQNDANSDLSSISDTEQENDDNLADDATASSLSRDVKPLNDMLSHPLLLNGQHPAFRNNLACLQPFPGVVTSAQSNGGGSGVHLPSLLANSAFRSPTMELAQRHHAYAQQMQLEWLARSAATLNASPSRLVDYHGNNKAYYLDIRGGR